MLIRKRHDLPSRVLTSKRTGSSNCIHESGNILTNQVSCPISNLNSNLNSNSNSNVSTSSSLSSSGSSNVRELDIKSRNVAVDIIALQNGGSGKYKMTHDVDGEEKKIADNDNDDNNNYYNDNNNKNHDISFIQNNIRSPEVKELNDANHNKIKKKNIPSVQSVPSDSSDSSDGEM